jgi:hypothetical protein
MIRKEFITTAAAGWAALALFAGLAFGQAPAGKRPVSAPRAGAAAPMTGGRLAPDDAAQLEERFTREIWPLLDRANGGCVSCHNAQNPSQLHFSADGPGGNFKKLLSGSFFEPENPVSLLARVTSPVKEQRMPPPPMKAWTDDEVGKLRDFVTDLYDKTHKSGVKADELFPPELLDPFTGKRVTGGPDNTFLTYRQLRGKIRTVFGDEWQRGERDLFQENIAQFGGADFTRRFDESSKASATYLSALDALGRDVASRAYVASTGPFAGRAETLPSPVAMKTPSPEYQAEITRLYRKMLFRNPTVQEVQQAFGFMKDIYREQQSVAGEDNTLDFELTVEDGSGRRTGKSFRVRTTNEPLGVFQDFLDQSAASEQPQAKKKLEGAFTFKPGASEQRFQISNEETSGNVSLAALELKGPLPEGPVKRIEVTDPSVTLQGAWQRRNGDSFASFEDANNNKGSSRIEIPISVEKEGKYELTVVWRRSGSVQVGRGRRAANSENADAVPIEVYSWDKSHIASPPLPPAPPKGEAHFTMDETVDTIPAWDLRTAFKFGSGPNEGVEIRNEGTKKRVVADSVKFVPVEKGGKEFLLDDPQAEGGWPKFNAPGFKPFNLVGEGSVSDNNEKKGEMKLLYRPSKSPNWSAGTDYRVLIGFPGQVDNETQVPVVVRAEESTPIIQMSAPLHADVGSTVTLDASTTYNLQGTPLKFTWKQMGGPRVKLSDPHAPKATFALDAMSPQQAAWEGLCRALIKHPDFLFTRPRSLALIRDKNDRRRLHLVKVAQDLVGRPPTEAELAQYESGAPLGKMIDQYLAGQEFKDFYFHRIRLVLESRGSDVDDEPVRLWCYVAFNDLPFKEILTADYTVDGAMQKQPRPAYHGKTGLLTMKGFVKGKPGLPHFNYAAVVTEKFLGYVFEVPPSIVMMREGITAAATTSPTSVCFSCHKVLTPLAHQRLSWDDEGNYKPMDGNKAVDDTDRGLVASYPFRGKGLEAFATQAVNKERFIRTMIQTHFVMFFGREMRYQEDERGLYKRLWDDAFARNFSIKSMLRTMMTSSEYLNGGAPADPAATPGKTAPKKPGRAPKSQAGSR